MNKPIILIVDDEPINLIVLKNILSPYFHVRACKSGADALNAALLTPAPDLILLDILMPGMDGFSVLGKLQENLSTQKIPVIFISGLDSPTDEKAGLQLGAVDYLVKPFRPENVLQRIEKHLLPRAGGSDE